MQLWYYPLTFSAQPLLWQLINVASLQPFAAARTSGAALPWAACTEAAHPGAVGRPVALEQVLLKVVLVAGEDLGAAVGRRKGPHVPHAQRVVLREKGCTVATSRRADTIIEAWRCI